MNETEFRAETVKLAEQLGLYVFWIPAAARTGIGRAAKTARGWPDLTIGSPRTGRLMHRELKSGTGDTSAQQDMWLWILAHDGRDVGIWHPADWESGRVRSELESLG